MSFEDIPNDIIIYIYKLIHDHYLFQLHRQYHRYKRTSDNFGVKFEDIANDLFISKITISPHNHGRMYYNWRAIPVHPLLTIHNIKLGITRHKLPKKYNYSSGLEYESGFSKLGLPMSSYFTKP